MPEKELPWAGPPKSHLRWPAMLFGVFGVSVGLLIVAIGIYALLDYSSENPRVEFQPPSTAHPETFARSSPNYQRAEPIPINRSSVPTETTQSLPSLVEPSSSSTAASSTSATDEAHAHAKSKQRTFVARAGEVTRLLNECDQEIKLWSERVLPLLENDLGKRLASDEALVRQFREVYKKDRPSSQLAAELRTSLTDLVAPIKAALDDTADVRIPRQELSEELARLQTEIKQLRDTLREPREQVDALIAAAQAMPPQANTLRQAMTAQQNAEMLAKTQKIDAQVMEANRLAAEEEAAAAGTLVTAKAKAEIERKKNEAEHARLVAKAKTPEVKRYLATFLAKSYFQPTGNYLSIRYERTTEELPVSFTRIDSSGALDPSVQGLRTLVILASAGFSPPNNWHGRPPWNFDIGTFSWSKSDQDFIQKAQDLLRELGPTLVELKMLAP